MKALIVNSGIGSRMGKFTEHAPKCMTEIFRADGEKDETILSRQIRLLELAGIEDIIITTGYMAEELIKYCNGLDYSGKITFVNNPIYKETNYIYSVFLARDYIQDDIILLHGDLVFDFAALSKIAFSEKSCMAVDSGMELPEKDFKAVISDTEEKNIMSVGVDFFENAIAAQPIYKLNKDDWMVWLDKIGHFCENGNTSCYAENAFNELKGACKLYALDVKGTLCSEIDTPEDLDRVNRKLSEKKLVYCCISSDIIHGGHMNIIEAAEALGDVTAGILSDEAAASCKKYPLQSYKETVELVSHISGIKDVIRQDELSYKRNLMKLRPDYVVHGDDWKTGFQSSLRQEVISVLSEWGGVLVELPYSKMKH